LEFRTIIEKGVPVFIVETDSETTIEKVIDVKGFDTATTTWRPSTASEIAHWQEVNRKRTSTTFTLDTMVAIPPLLGQ
jgi:hypothetical protein